MFYWRKRHTTTWQANLAELCAYAANIPIYLPTTRKKKFSTAHTSVIIFPEFVHIKVITLVAQKGRRPLKNRIYYAANPQWFIVKHGKLVIVVLFEFFSAPVKDVNCQIEIKFRKFITRPGHPSKNTIFVCLWLMLLSIIKCRAINRQWNNFFWHLKNVLH